MSILISNLSRNLSAVCTYEVRITDKQITTFQHNRADGLAACLMAAAVAVSMSTPSVKE